MHGSHWRCDVLDAAGRMAEAAAKRAERMAEKVEEIVKGVEDWAEKFAGSMPRPEFHYGHDTQQGHQPGEAHQAYHTHHSGNHHHSGPAPATTIYHHYHHGQSAATETSTTIVTSTAVTTSTSTITWATLTASTTVVTATTTAFVGSSAHLRDLTAEEDMLEHMRSASFWVLGFLLLIYGIALYSLLKYENPHDPKTKPSTEPEPCTSSIAQLDFDLTSLKTYITTPPRQIFAVTISRIATALYCFESYWIMKTAWNIFTGCMEGFWKLGAPAFSYFIIVMAPMFLFAWCGLCYGIYIILDLSFTFASELALLPVSEDASHAPTRKGKKRPKNDAFRGNKQADMDKQLTGSGSEEGWQTDLHG